MASVWFEGIEKLTTLAFQVEAGAARVGAAGALVVRKTAADVERDAKAFAPVDTGALRNSISTTISGSGHSLAIEAEIGPTVSYAVFQEYGTSRMAPHPYMGPAVERHTPPFVAAVEQLGGRIL